MISIERLHAGRNTRIGRAFRFEEHGDTERATRAWAAALRWDRVLLRGLAFSEILQDAITELAPREGMGARLALAQPAMRYATPIARGV